MFENLLNLTCDVYTRTTVVSQFGDAIDSYTLLYTGLKCRTIHKANTFSQFAGQVNAVAGHVLYVEKDYILDTTMRVVINGMTYNITHADAKYGYNGIHHAYYEIQSIESPQTGN